MEETTLPIKNMVCRRCIKAVERILKDMQRSHAKVELGKVTLSVPFATLDKEEFSRKLKAEGFELIDSREAAMVSAIKDELIMLIHHRDISEIRTNISDYLSEKLHKEYHYLSRLFSESENLTIEKFIIYQKIEKVKELLVYDQLSLKEIAFQMGYSSTAHLSSQFKKVTGFAPSQFKQLKQHKRKFIDTL